MSADGSVRQASVNSQRTASARMTMTTEAVRLAQSNLRAEEARNRVGRSTSYDILFRQDELALAEFNALNAQIDYLRATVGPACGGDVLVRRFRPGEQPGQGR